MAGLLAMEGLSRLGRFLMFAGLLFLGGMESAGAFTVESFDETNTQLQMASMRLVSGEQGASKFAGVGESPASLGLPKQPSAMVGGEQPGSRGDWNAATVQSAQGLSLYVASAVRAFFSYDATTGEPLGGSAGGSGTSTITVGGLNENVFVTIPDVFLVREYTREGEFVREVAGGIGANVEIPLFTPTSLLFNGAGELLIGDRGNQDIGELGRILRLRFNPSTSQYESLGTFVRNGSNFSPNDFAFGPNGNLFVSDFATQSVLEFSGSTGEFIRTFISDPRIVSLGGIEFAPNGDVFLGNGVSNLETQILRFDPNGGFLGVFASAQAFEGFAIGPDGQLYVSDTSDLTDQRILRYNIDTGLSEVFIPSGSGGLANPAGLAFGPAPIPEPDTSMALPGLFALFLVAGKGRFRS
jgi:DNA-binding beta-propeller fold protein YncE